jgi:hypothetical protein
MVFVLCNVCVSGGGSLFRNCNSDICSMWGSRDFKGNP